MKLTKLILALFIFGFVFLPKYGFAQQTCTLQSGGQTYECNVLTQETTCDLQIGGQTQTCSLENQTPTETILLPNPIGVDDLLSFVKTIFDVVWKIGIPVIALFIIYAGFKFVQARGNTTELEKAKKMFYGVIIGAAIVLGAWVLASAIGATVKKLQESQSLLPLPILPLSKGEEKGGGQIMS